MIEPTQFWPATAESWSALAANIVTVVGAITLVAVVQINLSLIVYWQRRAASAKEAAASLQDHAYRAAPRPANATLAILNAALEWKDAHTLYKDGLSPSEVGKLNERQRVEYDLWVSRLLAAFDLVLLDVNARSAADVQATIKGEIAKHSAILRTSWPFWRLRFPVSPLLQALIREQVRPTTS
jgi:nitrate/nitrite-specific signal transduction histidine kinase